MKLASLFSGGKDSTFAIYKARIDGHHIKCLVSLLPVSDESFLLHYPNMKYTALQAKAMKIPQILSEATSYDKNAETEQLMNMLKLCKNDFGIDGILHGGLFSDYQRNSFQKVADNLNLKVFSPLWHVDQKTYMQELLDCKFRFIITSVSSSGFDETWLGREITMKDVEELDALSKEYGFNLSFEGGEAETFVTDCPLFSSPIKIIRANKIWDGYRGRFEITEAI